MIRGEISELGIGEAFTKVLCKSKIWLHTKNVKSTHNNNDFKWLALAIIITWASLLYL
jgi:hypothetical protein